MQKDQTLRAPVVQYYFHLIYVYLSVLSFLLGFGDEMHLGSILWA